MEETKMDDVAYLDVKEAAATASERKFCLTNASSKAIIKLPALLPAKKLTDKVEKAEKCLK